MKASATESQVIMGLNSIDYGLMKSAKIIRSKEAGYIALVAEGKSYSWS
jgi:hypothetical protein